MSKNKVDADLYEFLQNHETGLCLDEYKNIVAYVHIRFDDLKDFVEIVGIYPFDEGGADAKMFETTICIDLNLIFEGDGNCILDYKNCFGEDDLENYKEALIKEKGED